MAKQSTDKVNQHRLLGLRWLQIHTHTHSLSFRDSLRNSEMNLSRRRHWRLCLHGRASRPRCSSTRSTKPNILSYAAISLFIGYSVIHFLRKLPSAIHLSVTNVQSWRPHAVLLWGVPQGWSTKDGMQRHRSQWQYYLEIGVPTGMRQNMLTNTSMCYGFVSSIGAIILNTHIIQIIVNKHSSLPPKSLSCVKVQFEPP